MVRHLFRDYLVFEDQYRAAQSLFKNLVDEVARGAGQEGDWKPWQLDDSFLPDVELIWDARSEQLARAVEIALWHPRRGEVQIQAFVRKIDYPGADYPKTDALQIALSPSKESIALTRTLLEDWMDPEVSYEKMENLIRELLPWRDEE